MYFFPQNNINLNKLSKEKIGNTNMDIQNVYANTSNLVYKWLGISFQMQVGKAPHKQLQVPCLTNWKRNRLQFPCTLYKIWVYLKLEIM